MNSYLLSLWTLIALAINCQVQSQVSSNSNLIYSHVINGGAVFCEYSFENGKLVNKDCHEFSLHDNYPNRRLIRKKRDTYRKVVIRKKIVTKTKRTCCIETKLSRKCGLDVCNKGYKQTVSREYRVRLTSREIAHILCKLPFSEYPYEFVKKLRRLFGPNALEQVPDLKNRYCSQSGTVYSSTLSHELPNSLQKTQQFLLGKFSKFCNNPDLQGSCSSKSYSSSIGGSSSEHGFRNLLLKSIRENNREKRLVCYFFNNGEYPGSYELIASELDKSKYWKQSNSDLNDMCSVSKHRPGFKKSKAYGNVYMDANAEVFAVCYFAKTGKYLSNHPTKDVIRSTHWLNPDKYFVHRCGTERPFRPVEFWFGEENEFSDSERPVIPTYILKKSKRTNGLWLVNDEDYKQLMNYIYHGDYFKQKHILKRALLPFGNPLLNSCNEFLLQKYKLNQHYANKACIQLKKPLTYHKVKSLDLCKQFLMKHYQQAQQSSNKQCGQSHIPSQPTLPNGPPTPPYSKPTVPVHYEAHPKPYVPIYPEKPRPHHTQPPHQYSPHKPSIPQHPYPSTPADTQHPLYPKPTLKLYPEPKIPHLKPPFLSNHNHTDTPYHAPPHSVPTNYGPSFNRCKEYLLEFYRNSQQSFDKPCCSGIKCGQSYDDPHNTSIPQHPYPSTPAHTQHPLNPKPTLPLYPEPKIPHLKPPFLSNHNHTDTPYHAPPHSVPTNYGPSFNRCKKYLLEFYRNSQQSFDKSCCSGNKCGRSYDDQPRKGQNYKNEYEESYKQTSHYVSSSSSDVDYSKSRYQDMYITIKLNEALKNKLTDLKEQIEYLSSMVKGQSNDLTKFVKQVLTLLEYIKQPSEIFKIKLKQKVLPVQNLSPKVLRTMLISLQNNVVQFLDRRVSSLFNTLQSGIQLVIQKLSKQSGKKRIRLNANCSMDGYLFI